jgi:hypothetical protein
MMTMAKAPKYLVIVLIVVAFALAASTLAAINVSQNMSSSGAILTSPNIGVYSDSACTTPVTTLSWGSVAAGSNATQTVYVKNTGTGSITLSMTVSNWSPAAASTYITITWDQQGTQLSAGQSVAATLTLTVSSSITGVTSFSNTITISGTS